MNAGNPNLFNASGRPICLLYTNFITVFWQALTPDQAQAAKEGLGKSYKDSSSTEDHRQFDLDIAKML